MDTPDIDLTRREKARELWKLIQYDPRLASVVLLLSLVTAVFEGIGLGFLLPIVQQVSNDGSIGAEEPILRQFATIYKTLGVPFTLKYLVFGLGVVITIKHITSFAVSWLRALLQTRLAREVKTQLFDAALNARIEHLDQRGSEELLNAIVKQADYPGKIIRTTISLIKTLLVSIVYLSIAFYLAPVYTVATIVLLGTTVYVIRFVLKPAYASGDQVAAANESIQRTAQAGLEGAREVKMFGMRKRLQATFDSELERYVQADVDLTRNKSLLSNTFQLVSSLVVFGLIYVSITTSTLSLGAIAVFLFAMFRLAPKINKINRRMYYIDGRLPHLIRTNQVLRELESERESGTPSASLRSAVTNLSFDNVSYTYPDDTTAVDGISFTARRGEFVAFVGPSGAGKSTVASLVSRLYHPTSGEIEADGVDITTLAVDEWRSRVAVVRQQPYLFNDTLRFNLTVGNPEATQMEITRACDIACVSEFVESLPDGYETVLGDDGVRLSGGQRQRVAIARALLTDADIIVLDEATSDLDTALEVQIHEALESLNTEFITIAIAHRLSTVVDADRIFVVEDGRIVERGKHRDLVRKEGTYAELSRAQSYQ